MKNRILLKEIPAGKFHSVIFTTYSINIYYLEQQVLPLLSSKGIHYVSVLADSIMLGAQLDAYSFLSDERKRNYAINGIQCDGAFHPKIIFLAGEATLLLLVGSGNLTSSGHGKNLEAWNAIYIDSESDKKLGFLIQAWNYLKRLHADLGISAQFKLKSIEENCQLLSNVDNVAISNTYEIDNQTKISFLAANGRDSIFKQLTLLVGKEIIERVTTMTPYYDSEGNLLHQLNNYFKPTELNIILQEGYGTLPFDMMPADNMHFYYWSDIKNGDVKQKYFHSKNLVIEGKSRTFLVSGSANSTLAAFGSDIFNMTNQEVCILYQSNSKDFIKALGLNFNGKAIDLKDCEVSSIFNQNTNTGNKSLAFIKTVEKSYDIVTVYISSKDHVTDGIICLFNTKGKIVFQKDTEIEKGETSIKIDVTHGLSLLYCEIFVKANSVSNKQFIIDINAFERANPSPKNRSLNQIRKLIESGNFSTPKIIEYLNTIYRQKEVKKVAIAASSKSDNEEKKDIITEEESDLLYLSYDEIQEKIKHLDEIKKAKGYIEYKSVRLWDSIFSYLKENKEKEEQSKIDEEETEDINKSSGRLQDKKEKSKKPISKSNHDRLKEKVERFLVNYSEILESKINNKNVEKPSLIDLSMFLVILEVLLHLLSHKEKIEGQEKDEHLLQISFSTKEHSWSEFVIHFIGLFTLWCSQKGGFKKIDNSEYKLKVDLYKKMAFKTSISALSMFSAVNKSCSQDKIITWKELSLLNANLSFNTERIVHKDIEEFDMFLPQETRIEIGEANFEEEFNESLRIINKTNLDKQFYLHPTDGITFIAKEIINQKNKAIKFLKLLNTGYRWDDEFNDFWNGKVFSVEDLKWFSSK